jgi:hypothetical protein
VQLFILVVIAITIINIYFYRTGLARNRRLIVDTCRMTERVFQPIDTSYTNIGGVIGYNIAFKLVSPFISLEGVVTTSPRHTILYLPISRLLGRSDTLILSVAVESLPAGEAHLVAVQPYSLGRIQLDDTDDMRMTPIGDGTFAILSYNDIQESRMRALFADLTDPSPLVHLGFYGKTGCFSIVVNPASPQTEQLLKEIRDALLDAFDSGP